MNFIKEVENALKQHVNLKFLESYQAAKFHLIQMKNARSESERQELEELIKFDLYLCNIII